MEDTTHIEMLKEARNDLWTVGEMLLSWDRFDHCDWLATLFVVREAVIEVLEMFPKDKATKSLYVECCARDIMYFSAMVHDLLVNGASQCALDISSRYRSIVEVLLAQLGTHRNPTQPLKIRWLTIDSFEEPDVPEINERIIREEIDDIQIELHELKQWIKVGRDNELRKRKAYAVELVRIRERLHQFFWCIHENAPDEESVIMALESFNDAFYVDDDQLGLIVSSLIDDGMCPEAPSMLDKLMDFAQRIKEFTKQWKYEVFLWPYKEIQFSTGDIGGDGEFDVTLN